MKKIVAGKQEGKGLNENGGKGGLSKRKSHKYAMEKNLL